MRQETAGWVAYTANGDAPFPNRGTQLNWVRLAIAIAVVLVVALLALPVKQRCGAPGFTCATGLDAQGYVHYYYEVEPLGIYLIESITGSNIRFYYKSGEEREKADLTVNFAPTYDNRSTRTAFARSTLVSPVAWPVLPA